MKTFEELLAAGYVKLEATPEEEPHDLSYVDTWDLGPEETAQAKREILKTIDRDGLWMWAASYRESDKLPWTVVYTIGDCVGADLDPGYVADAKRACEEAHAEAKRRAWFAQGARNGFCDAPHVAMLADDSHKAATVNTAHVVPLGGSAYRSYRAGYIMGAGVALERAEQIARHPHALEPIGLPDSLRWATLPDPTVLP
jgi:hypothetical protein